MKGAEALRIPSEEGVWVPVGAIKAGDLPGVLGDRVIMSACWVVTRILAFERIHFNGHGVGAGFLADVEAHTVDRFVEPLLSTSFPNVTLSEIAEYERCVVRVLKEVDIY